MEQHTHNLDLRIAIDAMGLVSQDNIAGAKIALGVEDDNKVLAAFCDMLASNISKTLERFSNVAIIDGNVAPIESEPVKQEEPVLYHGEDKIEKHIDEPEVNEEMSPIDLAQSIPLPNEMALINGVFDKIFKLKSEGNSIFSLSVKDETCDTKVLSRELGLEEDRIDFNTDIKDDYVIQYIDADGNNHLLEGAV